MLSRLLHRSSRRLLLEYNPHRILAAGFTRPDRGPAEISCAAEFARDDEAGLRAWLEANAFRQRSVVPTLCSYASSSNLLHREIVQPRKLADRDYVVTLLQEECHVFRPDDWTIHIVNPSDGAALPPEGGSRPALVTGIAKTDIRGLQQRMFEHRLAPEAIEPGLLPLFGTIFQALARQGDKRSVVVVVVEDDATFAYILGKEGIYTPNPIRYGLRSLLNFAGKELDLTDDAEILRRLENPDEQVRLRAPKFARVLGRELKPVVDSAEMSTGQPVGGIFFAYLPPPLAWLAEPLSSLVERPPIDIDCNEWMPGAGLRPEPGLPPFGPHWLGALSLLADFTEPGSSSSPAKDGARGPWHVDCSLPLEDGAHQIVRRRFMGGAFAASLAAFAAIVVLWQVYVAVSLRDDTTAWEKEMAGNEQLFAELTRANRELQAGATRLSQAYELMASPYQVSEFVMNLGRTLPSNMRVDRIESNQGRIAVSGGLREPSDSAGGKLNRYLEDLRRNPAIGPVFASIGLTALQRDEDPDWLVFEITFKPKPVQP